MLDKNEKPTEKIKKDFYNKYYKIKPSDVLRVTFNFIDLYKFYKLFGIWNIIEEQRLYLGKNNVVLVNTDDGKKRYDFYFELKCVENNKAYKQYVEDVIDFIRLKYKRDMENFKVEYIPLKEG
jgi:hypothetical protein